MRKKLRRIERWLKKRIRVIRGIDCLERTTPVEDVLPLGSEYGGWAICPVGIDDESVVYSIGVGGDITFDTELINRFGVTVHAFDPIPSPSLSTAEVERLVLHDYGIAERDGNHAFHPINPSSPRGSHTILSFDSPDEGASLGKRVKMKRLVTVMQDLGHDHIDILKMDIEGAEWALIPDIINSHLDIYQILIEFHHLLFRQVGVKATEETIRLLKDRGYDIFYISEKGQEYGFIRRDLYTAKTSKPC